MDAPDLCRSITKCCIRSINGNYKISPGAGPRDPVSQQSDPGIRAPCQDSSQGLSTPEARNTRKLLFPPNHIANTFPAPSALDVMERALTLSLYYQHTWYGVHLDVIRHTCSAAFDLGMFRTCNTVLSTSNYFTSSAQHRRPHARKNWTANGAFIDHTLIPSAFLIIGTSRTLYIFYTE